MQGLRLTENTCHRHIARPAIPELPHHLHRLTDYVRHGQSVLKGVQQGVHTPRNSHPVVRCSQPRLLLQECEHGKSCLCSCIDRLCGSQFCHLQAVQSPCIMVGPVSSIRLSTSPLSGWRWLIVAERWIVRRAVAMCMYKTSPLRAREGRTIQSAPNGR